MGNRVTLVLDDGIDDLLIDLAGSPRKRGQYVSELVRVAWAARQSKDRPVDVQALALTVKVVERRLDQVESQVSALIAKSS